nr:MAG TPA: type I neck protein [Caudoviricetes sp.]
MIRVVQRGNFSNTEKFLSKAQKVNVGHILEKYGMMGVNALSAATPYRTGKTASSWGYDISIQDGKLTISWTNSNVNKHVNIALILQYGHGTRNGGYVEGIDYINPAMRPVFEKIANEAWNEVVG